MNSKLSMLAVNMNKYASWELHEEKENIYEGKGCHIGAVDMIQIDLIFNYRWDLWVKKGTEHWPTMETTSTKR